MLLRFPAVNRLSVGAVDEFESIVVKLDSAVILSFGLYCEADRVIAWAKHILILAAQSGLPGPIQPHQKALVMSTEPPELPAVLPFQVDLRGVVDLLSRHIYSSPRVFLRELLQNGRDAIAARAQIGQPNGDWGIRITPISAASDIFIFTDDGIGLSIGDVGELLSTVGRSSKRDLLDLPRSDFLGQFGIGLLSCFMVADQIVIRSRSAHGTPPVEWIGYGDGTYTARELAPESDIRVGTSVYLSPRADERSLLETTTVLSLARDFGGYLSVPVRVDLPAVGVELVTRHPEFAAPFEKPSQELLSVGRALVGAEPFAAIPLSVPGTGTRGTAFVLPYSPAPGARQAHTVYLNRMLVGSRIDDILPEWAFFVRAVIDTTGLHPTASREAFVDDEALEFTRRGLGEGLRRWILTLGNTAPQRLNEFIAIHHLALKSLMLHDDELARFIVKWLTLETSLGAMTVEILVRDHTVIRYVETVDEFRQIENFARADRPVVNGGYVYDTEIVKLLPSLFPSVRVEKLNLVDELDALNTAPLADHSAALRLEERASAALGAVACGVVVRALDQPDLPAVFVADPNVFRTEDRKRARDASGPLWGGVLGLVDDFVLEQRAAMGRAAPVAQLCLNWNSPMVHTVAAVIDDAVFSRSLSLLYIQALLAGHHRLTATDRELMTRSLTDLIALSVGTDSMFH